jgi:hypothetical protein
MYTNLKALGDVIELRITDLLDEIVKLKEENQRLREGLEGACYACEPVGALNQKLITAGHALYHALGYFTDDFEFMNDSESLFTAERSAVNNWRDLFDNNVPEQNYEN